MLIICRLKAASNDNEDIEIDVDSRSSPEEQQPKTPILVSSQSHDEKREKLNVVELSTVVKKRKKMPELIPIRPNVVVANDDVTMPRISKLEIQKVRKNISE